MVAEARAALKGRLVIDYVPADYHADYPKTCMGGWATTGLNVAPDGLVLPCHAAQTIKTLTFDTVRTRPLAEIWHEGAAFNAFRGTKWMQAMAIAGDPAATDPVCVKSPHHARMRALAEDFAGQSDADLTWRVMEKTSE